VKSEKSTENFNAPLSFFDFVQLFQEESNLHLSMPTPVRDRQTSSEGLKGVLWYWTLQHPAHSCGRDFFVTVIFVAHKRLTVLPW